MKIETLKVLRKIRRENTQIVHQAQVLGDKRTKRNRTRSEQKRRAINEYN